LYDSWKIGSNVTCKALAFKDCNAPRLDLLSYVSDGENHTWKARINPGFGLISPNIKVIMKKAKEEKICHGGSEEFDIVVPRTFVDDHALKECKFQ
jgi:hypothetical protein